MRTKTPPIDMQFTYTLGKMKQNLLKMKEAIMGKIQENLTTIQLWLINQKAKLNASRKEHRGFSMLEVVVVVGVLMTLAVGTFFLYAKVLENAKKMEEQSSDPKTDLGENAPISQAPTPIAEPPVPFDPTFLYTSLSIIGILIVLAAVIWGAIVLTKRQNKINARIRTEGSQIKGIVAEASKKINATMLESADYETNLAKQIEYPLMTDVTQEPVGNYIKAMRLATFTRDSLSPAPTLEMANAYLKTATDFEVTFKAAESWAIRNKWSNFTVAEVRRLKDAKVSLSLLEDATTSPDQRNALYKRLEKLLSGLVHITDPVKLALSVKVPMLSLEMAKG
jgi:type II secretory pathway pseudopilin PulG